MLIVLIGVAVVLIGLLVSTGMFNWFGRLPGDIRVERENFRLYVPIVSMLIASIVLTLILAVVRRLF